MQNKHQLAWARGITDQYEKLGLTPEANPISYTFYLLAQAIIADSEAADD